MILNETYKIMRKVLDINKHVKLASISTRVCISALWTVLAVALFDHWFTCTKYAAMLDRECNVAIAFLILALVLGVTVAILTILILCYVKERC